MKHLLTLGVIASCAVAIACGGGDSGQTDTAEDTQSAARAVDDHDHAAGDDHDHDHAAGDGHDHDHAAGDGHDHGAQDAYGQTAPAGQNQATLLQTGSEISLTGNMGCGHCNFQIGNSCSAAMKTADGHIVIFDGVAPESELFQNRMSGAEITVAGVVSYDPAGVAHMTVKEM